MLPSASRLRKKSDFGRAYAKGRSYATDLIVVYVRGTGGVDTRVGFSVSKKLGKAVARNKVKRRLREAARSLLPHLPRGYDIIVVARVKSANATFEGLCRSMGDLLAKSGILKAHD